MSAGSLIVGSRLAGAGERLPARLPDLLAAFLVPVALGAAWLQGSAFLLWVGVASVLLPAAARRPRAALLLCAMATVLGVRLEHADRLTALRPEDLLLAAAASGVWVSRGARPRSDPPLLAAILLLVGLGALALLRSVLTGSASGIEPFLVLARAGSYALLYLLVARDVAGDGDSRSYLVVLLLSAAMLGAIACLETWLPHPFVPGTVYRALDRGPWLGQANHAAGALAGMAAMAVALLIGRARELRLRAVALFSLPPTLGGLAATGSRQALLAFGAALLLVVALRRPRWFPAGVAAVLLALSPLGVGPRIFSALSDFMPREVGVGSWQARLFNWDAALSGSDLLLGSGLGSRPHGFYESQWVQILAETGVVGLLVVLGTIGWTARLLLRRGAAERAADRDVRLAALGFLVVLVVQGAATVTFLTAKTAAPFAVALGAVLGAAREGQATGRPGSPRARS